MSVWSSSARRMPRCWRWPRRAWRPCPAPRSRSRPCSRTMAAVSRSPPWPRWSNRPMPGARPSASITRTSSVTRSCSRSTHCASAGFAIVSVWRAPRHPPRAGGMPGRTPARRPPANPRRSPPAAPRRLKSHRPPCRPHRRRPPTHRPRPHRHGRIRASLRGPRRRRRVKSNRAFRVRPIRAAPPRPNPDTPRPARRPWSMPVRT